MTGTLLTAGDEVDVVVTSVKPFGLFVESDTGVHGLVRGGGAAVGATVRVRVIEFDAAESRFHATLVD
ncbi:S1 RNA-binding domain-containing protein [Micromonospora sp. PLK6-60]|uniref:S1 RNA-binding domain-containing protein n=1 Tax=Micromonospora sp. PLK6-60 TaxID=2873383 RepID=UPI001CA78223|nr:S1 RNA-binding domain-containing protein [Micromonospora sp. PLK6-60]MBY8874193.1 S1 RNA-binding domain-containing protein [Micromonospora sp. PLK6-60]